MEFRFTLIDRYGKRTVVDEPLGWDSFSMRVKRHPTRHGTFRSLQGNNFQFVGKAKELLKEEYEKYGLRGDYRIEIDWLCDNGWDNYFTGTLSFEPYDDTQGQVCMVELEVDQTGPLVSFINRFDQKVDIDSLVAFDQVTALTPYDRLSRIVTLPSKTIVLRGIAKNTGITSYSLSGDSGWSFGPGGTGTVDGSINPCFTVTEVNSIKSFSPSANIDFFRHISAGNEWTPEIIHNDVNQDLNCVGNIYNVEFRIKGRYKNLTGGSGSNNLNLVFRKGPNNFNDGATNTTINFWLVRSSSNAVFTQAFDISYTATVTLPPGHYLWLDFFIQYVKTTNYSDNVQIEIDPETYFKATVESKCDPTQAKLYMINEVASRITEAITNNEMKVYSELLGRKDSDPYSFPSAGCAALRALTTGLHIRRSKQSDGTDPKLFLSMQDLFDHLSATDNIGIGNEGDDKIRIEPWTWFYKSNVIHRCDDIDVVHKQAQASEHYSLFKTGYDKWESEDFNGQDEILTSRQFRLQFSQIQNTLEKVSKIIGSGYAIETTRRKGPTDSDWRFDSDAFVICLQNKIFASTSQFLAFSHIIQIPFTQFYQVGFQSHTIVITGSASNDGTYTVVAVSTSFSNLLIQVAETLVNESGAAIVIEDTDGHYAVELDNISSPANLVDPPTVYNYRITPIRMAMKWFNTIAAAYRNIANTDKLIFNAGDGNFIAAGEMKNPDCKQEAGVMAENADISLTSFDDPDEARPINFLERVPFTYPLGAGDFKKILADPYGLIAYKSCCESGEGWIDEIEHFPVNGSAKFILIPKIPS